MWDPAVVGFEKDTIRGAFVMPPEEAQLYSVFLTSTDDGHR